MPLLPLYKHIASRIRSLASSGCTRLQNLKRRSLTITEVHTPPALPQTLPCTARMRTPSDFKTLPYTVGCQCPRAFLSRLGRAAAQKQGPVYTRVERLQDSAQGARSAHRKGRRVDRPPAPAVKLRPAAKVWVWPAIVLQAAHVLGQSNKNCQFPIQHWSPIQKEPL